MNAEIIHARIRELTLERRALQINHDALVQKNQKDNNEFQAEVTKNQTRFAQLTGGITELQKLIETINEGNNHNDNSIPTPGLGDRTVDVCARQQPEGR
jgi:glutaredoxin 2